MYKIGLPLIAISFGILNINQINPPTYFPDILINNKDFLGYLFLIVGLVLTGMSILKYILSAIRKGSNVTLDILDSKFSFEFHEEYCDFNEIKKVSELGVESIGSNHASTEVLKKRFSVNDKIIKCGYKRTNNKKRLSCFYILYPINKVCTDLIESSQIKNGKGIDLSHLTKTYSDAKAIYVSMIFGSRLGSKAFIIYRLKKDLENILNTNGITTLYSKPSTRAGKNLLIKNDFEKISNESEIYKLIIKR